jgi:hypothetical protein
VTQSTELSKRTPEEVFAHHAQSLGAEDPDATALDYAEGAYLITQDGVMRGKDAIRGFFAGVFQALPQAKWGVKTTYVENILFLEWTADSKAWQRLRWSGYLYLWGWADPDSDRALHPRFQNVARLSYPSSLCTVHRCG